MSPLTAELKGGKELLDWLARAGGRATDLLAEGMFLEAEGVMGESKREVDVDQGTLRASGYVKEPVINRSRGGDTVLVVMGYGGAASGYAVYLHEGTGPNVGQPPFMPPVEPFREWAKRVLGDERLGFVIARAVGARGLGPRKYLERPLMRRAPNMEKNIGAHIRRGLERKA